MEKLFDSILGSNQSSIDWAGIPPGYSMLWITGRIRSTTVAVSSNVGFRFNGDSGTNYALQYNSLSGTTQSGGASKDNTSNLMTVVAASGDAQAFSSFNIWIPDYASTTPYKTADGKSTLIPTYATVANYRTDIWSWLWKSTAAINEITWIEAGGNQIASGSRLICWGIP